jgi:tetratricopeptide (TPR) repeat protein
LFAEFYLEFKKDNLKEASAIIDQVIDKYLKGEIPKRDIASFYQDKGLTLKLEDYERAYESFLQAFYIYEEYEDIPKQLQITELVLKLFQIWEQNNDLPDWEKRKIRLEKLMKEKNLQFAQHEML